LIGALRECDRSVNPSTDVSGSMVEEQNQPRFVGLSTRREAGKYVSLKVYSRSAPTRFVARVLLLASTVILASPSLIAGASTELGSTPNPTVSSFEANSSSLTSSGGEVKLTANVTYARLCEFGSAPAIAGLPASVACLNGKVKDKVILPINATTAAESYTFTLKVKGMDGVKVKSTTMISVAPRTPPSSLAAFVQADDTGTFNGNTTSIGSGRSNQVLAQNTGIGHSVVLEIQTLTDPGTQTDTVTSVSSGMGTFQFVNSYNDGADTEIWVCLDTTGAADTVTVTTPTNAWDAFAVEFNAPATGFINGGGAVTDPNYLAKQSWTLSPGAAGNIVVLAVDTLDAFVTGPAAPWTYYNAGYWDFPNGTSAAWQVAPSSSPLTATWRTDGGLSSSQGVVLEY
jgi:hypothetical protein